MQLYRLMTEVRAGANQAGSVRGRTGIATIWVRAEDEKSARKRGEQILAGRAYEGHGELQLYLEETADDAAFQVDEAVSDKGRSEGEVLSGYSEIKKTALDRGDGLFEAWFPS